AAPQKKSGREVHRDRVAAPQAVDVEPLTLDRGLGPIALSLGRERRIMEVQERSRPVGAPRRGGRAADCTGLENRQRESVRGFESLPLRFGNRRNVALASPGHRHVPAIGWPGRPLSGSANDPCIIRSSDNPEAKFFVVNAPPGYNSPVTRPRRAEPDGAVLAKAGLLSPPCASHVQGPLM